MDAKALPSRPSLEQCKKQAKDLLRSHQAGDPEALPRIQQYHPRFSKLPDSEVRTVRFVLADAHLIIAREHGFVSWPKFAQHLAAQNRESSTDSIWKSAENALITGDVAALGRLLRRHEELFSERQPPASGSGGLRPTYAGGDARSIIVRNHQFDSWARFTEYRRALQLESSTVAQFEAAVDAVVSGDVATLEGLLRKRPDLIRARSTRQHHSTLLHYVGANGVEYFRQKTPRNAVKVAKTLLDAGAEVNSEAEMYGGSTTLGLISTSLHPLQAGVQNDLIETLLDYAAVVDGGFGDANVGGYTHGAVIGCLANGCGEAAEFLANRGARLDLEGAAGVGRLDLVKSFFNAGGDRQANVTQEQMKSGFRWACEYGRASIVEFLLHKGIEVNTRLRQHGETGLHWAAISGHREIVELLLARKAPVDVKDETWGGTPLGWALFGWGNPRSGTRGDRHYRVVALLVGAGSDVEPEWLAAEKVLADPRMLTALRGEMPRQAI